MGVKRQYSHGRIKKKLIVAYTMKYRYLIVANPVGVISATTKFHSQALPVLIAVIGTRALSGEISAAYRNVRPRNPVGKNKLNKKMATPATMIEALSLGAETVPAKTVMQQPMPIAAKIISLRRPKRSTVNTPIGEQTVWKVKTEAPRMRESIDVSPRYCSKMVGK